MLLVSKFPLFWASFKLTFIGGLGTFSHAAMWIVTGTAAYLKFSLKTDSLQTAQLLSLSIT
jgi:hypothetical protein